MSEENLNQEKEKEYNAVATSVNFLRQHDASLITIMEILCDIKCAIDKTNRDEYKKQKFEDQMNRFEETKIFFIPARNVDR